MCSHVPSVFLSSCKAIREEGRLEDISRSSMARRLCQGWWRDTRHAGAGGIAQGMSWRFLLCFLSIKGVLRGSTTDPRLTPVLGHSI